MCIYVVCRFMIPFTVYFLIGKYIPPNPQKYRQRLLAGLRQQGAADSTLLEELGIKLAPNSALSSQKS